VKIEIGAPEIRAKVRAPKVTAETGTPVAREYTERPEYTGPYTVSPGAAAQTLATANKRMTGDVVVGPIPSNYGLITWDGGVLTVS
jgi:hypothetical protein